MPTAARFIPPRSARARRRVRPQRAAPPLAALALAALSLASPLTAQQSAPLEPGARLRVSAVAPARVLVGEYLALTDTTLLLTRREQPLAVALREIARVEFSRGRRPGVVGGVVGFLAGAVLGGVIGCAANRDSYGVFCGGQDDTTVFGAAALGGVAGGAAGALLFRRERWTVIAEGPWGAVRE